MLAVSSRTILVSQPNLGRSMDMSKMSNDEYAARNIMKWPEKLGGWVTPEGFVDRAFWKPGQDRNQLESVLGNCGFITRLRASQSLVPPGSKGHVDIRIHAMIEPTVALEAIVKAHKESEE